ncbi:MAG TPA: WecB/TagA/CpsF family glycosyltransferase [Candidatus Eisenbacteria bacterium]|jgi:N-acetylglucosaminyldiphosphoundecaprenol N-acetyl-beta-D-mannosaminyltransferase|nr:WecB/TagA/CpsF family glycosyltransferase [Candidatus Eisenbacteria bacterium]
MKILGVRYDNLQFAEAMDRTFALLDNGRRNSVFFLNLDCLYHSQKDAEYREALAAADLVLADGIGLRAATAIWGGRMRANCNGTDFSPAFFARAAAEKRSVFLLGAREGVADEAGRRLRARYPGLVVAGTMAGYLDNDEAAIAAVNASGAEALFVAMGAPLQEKWIRKNRARLKPALCLGVGALFDYLSGRVPRAPRLFRAAGMEWCWRILIEPGRMGARYLGHDLPFLFRIFLESRKGRTDGK